MAADPLRTPLDLSLKARRSVDRIRRDLRAGHIHADQLGRDYLFTPDQFTAALDYYRQRRKEERRARKHRTNRPQTVGTDANGRDGG